MKCILKIPRSEHSALLQHLLPPGGWREEAAFLMVRCDRTEDTVTFEFLEAIKLRPEEFQTQEGDYIELTDATRARVIKRAHDLKACLVEVHCHPGPYRAAFSDADWRGLRETVPHMFWRLANRPYLAVVVAESGFDALVWIDNPTVPHRLHGILAGEALLHPTNLSQEPRR